MGKHDERIAWLEDGIGFMRDLGEKLISGTTKIFENGVDISKEHARDFEERSARFQKLADYWKSKND
ncbi:MAG: hypothetical protein JSR89_02180 [Proteobacteria bacterium]|nr:hypothetical protein [Pseudomonadota bacterium]